MLIEWFLSIKSLPNLLFGVLCLPGGQSQTVCATVNKPSCVLHLLDWLIGSHGFSSLERRPEYWVLHDNVGQRTHFPDCGVQPNTGCPYVLFFLATSHLWMLFILPQSPKHDYSLTVWKENHFHPSLHDSAFYRTLMWWCWDFTPGGHSLWPLRGHLQTLAKFDNHESAVVYSAVAVGLNWWIFTWCISSSPVYNLPFCVPMSLTTPAVTYSLSSNLPSLAPVFLPSRCWPMMGPLVWSSLHSYLSPMWAFCAPWRILFRMGCRKLDHQWLPHHCAGSLLCALLLICVRPPSTLKWSCSVVPPFCNPMDCSLSGTSVHGIFQARILECVAISFHCTHW